MARRRHLAGDEPHLVLLHPTFDQLASTDQHQIEDGVHIHYVGQMLVYGLPGQRRPLKPLKLAQVSLQSAWALARKAISLAPEELVLCKPQPVNSAAVLWAAWRGPRGFSVDCDDYEAGANRFAEGGFGALQRKLVAWCEDQVPRWARQVTVNTRFLQARYRSLGVAESRLQWVPNTADAMGRPDAQQVAELRAKLGLGDRPVIAYVGTLNQVAHAVDLLLEAMPRVWAVVPGVKLLIVGDGDGRVLLQRQAENLEIDGEIVWCGNVPYNFVPLYYALANCSVDPVFDTPAARGRSPLKIVESLAAGTSVVTGDVGDRSEMIGRSDVNQATDAARFNSVVVRPGDAQALADGIITLLESQKTHQKPTRP